jgi:hypothetical protein
LGVLVPPGLGHFLLLSHWGDGARRYWGYLPLLFDG